MSSEAAALLAGMVRAYRPYAESRLPVPPDAVPPGLSEALEEGERWLHAELQALLSLPYADQPRAPLELFQEAMRFPTVVLEAAGVDPPQRDPVTEAALPGDLYVLAPASSRELGDEVWKAHLAWGSAKASAMQRPAIGLLSADLMDRSRIEAVVVAAGFRLVVWSSGGSVSVEGRRPVRALVDLDHPDADGVISALASFGVATVAFGPHVDDLGLVRARSLGAVDALPRSRFFRTLPDLLPTLA